MDKVFIPSHGNILLEQRERAIMDRPFTCWARVDSWNTIIFLARRSALKEVSTGDEILNDEFLGTGNSQNGKLNISQNQIAYTQVLSK